MHPEYQFHSHFCKIGDLHLHYIDEGEGPIVVLVHGNPTWSFFYRKIIALLKGHYRVIAIDNMGCGLSDKPQNYNYSLHQHICNLSAVLENLGVNRLSMVVHDWGGAIGMGYAVTHPHSIDRIVVLNTAAFRSNRIPWRIRFCRLPIIGTIIVRGFNGFAYPATFMAVSKRMDRQTKQMYLLPYNSWSNRVAVHRFVKDIPLSPSHPSYNTLVDIEKKLTRIKDSGIPVLILWGGRDFCFTKHFYDEWLQRIPGAEAYYFPEKGHYVLEDDFSELAPLLRSFFNI